MERIYKGTLYGGRFGFHLFRMSEPIKIFKKKGDRVALHMGPIQTGMFWSTDGLHRLV